MANPFFANNAKFYISATPLTSVNSATQLTSAEASGEMKNLSDVKTDMSKDTVEIKDRSNNGWTKKIGTTKDCSVTGTYTYNNADVNYIILRNAYLNNTEVAGWVLDSDPTATGSAAEGPAGNFNVTKLSRSESSGDVLKLDVEFSPSSYTHWFQKGVTT